MVKQSVFSRERRNGENFNHSSLLGQPPSNFSKPANQFIGTLGLEPIEWGKCPNVRVGSAWGVWLALPHMGHQPIYVDTKNGNFWFEKLMSVSLALSPAESQVSAPAQIRLLCPKGPICKALFPCTGRRVILNLSAECFSFLCRACQCPPGCWSKE